MKKIMLTMMALVLTMAAQGQTETVDTAQFVAVYGYECRTQDDEGKTVTDQMQVVVQVGRTVVKSMPRSAYPVYDNESKPDVAAGFQEALMHMPTVWTGLPAGQTTVREFIFPHEYEGYEETPAIAWTLTDDTLTASGYLCQQATVTFRGVAWAVWYTEEIPSSAGPWRLRGLPGLIVKAESEAHTFCLAGLRQEASPITAPEQNPEVHRMKYAKLLKHKNEIYGNREYAKNPSYYVPDLNGSITDMSVLNHNGQQLLLANGGHPLLTKAHVYKPLELE
ncbi:MAG: GLPGLI family protein [Bacteroidaceae bacterium]|nr:GLPGLI family protein [Bacteroidaceae bacterium]